ATRAFATPRDNRRNCDIEHIAAPGRSLGFLHRSTPGASHVENLTHPAVALAAGLFRRRPGRHRAGSFASARRLGRAPLAARMGAAQPRGLIRAVGGTVGSLVNNDRTHTIAFPKRMRRRAPLPSPPRRALRGSPPGRPPTEVRVSTRPGSARVESQLGKSLVAARGKAFHGAGVITALRPRASMPLPTS